MAPSKTVTCHCGVYAFPHRMSGGRCEARPSDQLCGSCGRPATTVRMDFGIGAYEYWGFRGVDRDVRTVSECCEADLVPNTAEGAQRVAEAA